MANDRAGALIDLLRENQLLEPAQLDEITKSPDARETDPELLAQCLLELGWVTLYQLDLVTQKKAQELRIGSYLVMDKVGIGGCGPAYKVRRPGKPGVFLLKQFPKASLPADQLALFNQDVRLAAQIQHPNIAPVASVGALGNQFLYLRDFVNGTDLAQTVRDSGPLPVARACAVVRQAALALQHAHDKGLIHRRVKPANLVALQNGQALSVKLVDFGLANIKPRTKEDKGDRSGDIRGLGRTLCYLLTGRAPAPPDTTWLAPPGSGPLSTLRAGIALEVQAIASKMLAAGVSADGYRSMAEVAAALEPHSHEPVPPAPVVNGTPAAAAVATAPEAPPPGPSDSGPAPSGPPATEAISRSEDFGPARMEVEPASVPFAVAVVQAVVVERHEDSLNVVASGVAGGIPMAVAAPPSAMPVLPEPPPSPFLTTARAVAVAVQPAVGPVDVSPAFALESAPAHEPVNQPAAEQPSPAVEDMIPMASAVVAAVPAAFAVEPATELSTSVAPPPEPPPAPLASAALVSPEPPAVSAPPPPPEPAVKLTPVESRAPAPQSAPASAAAPAPAANAPLHTPELSPAPEPAPPVWPPAAAPPALEGLAASAPLAPAPSTQPVEVTPLENIPLGSMVDAPHTSFTDAPPSPFTDAPASPFADAPAGEIGFPMAGEAGPRRKTRKKLSKGTIIGLLIGAALHLIFIVGIVLWAMGVFSQSSDPPPRTGRVPRSTPRAKTQPAPFPMDTPKPKPKTTTKGGDVNPFDDIKD